MELARPMKVCESWIWNYIDKSRGVIGFERQTYSIDGVGVRAGYVRTHCVSITRRSRIVVTSNVSHLFQNRVLRIPTSKVDRVKANGFAIPP